MGTIHEKVNLILGDKGLPPVPDVLLPPTSADMLTRVSDVCEPKETAEEENSDCRTTPPSGEIVNSAIETGPQDSSKMSKKRRLQMPNTTSRLTRSKSKVMSSPAVTSPTIGKGCDKTDSVTDLKEQPCEIVAQNGEAAAVESEEVNASSACSNSVPRRKSERIKQPTVHLQHIQVRWKGILNWIWMGIIIKK